jgi:hypothetical protein
MSTGLAIASGIAQGIEKATYNIYQIGMAKEKLNQQKELFTLDKKVKEAQLKRYEKDPNADPEIYAQQVDITKKENRLMESKLNAQLGILSASEKGNKVELEGWNKKADILNSFALGASTQKISIDEQVKRKVALGQPLSTGEKQLWDRMGKKTAGNGFVDAMNEGNGSEMPGSVPAESAASGKSDWWSQ